MRIARRVCFMIWLLCLAPAIAKAAGFQLLAIPNGADSSLAAGVWYPSHGARSLQPGIPEDVVVNGPVDGRALPLIVISHGAGGSLFNNHDLALFLADQGYAVAAVTHTSDKATVRDQFLIRSAQMVQLVDYMLERWPGHITIDPSRIGIYGFSAGGLTALVAVGGEPDFAQRGVYCADHSEDQECRLPPAAVGRSPENSEWFHDPRIKAAVVAAPALGFSFTRSALQKVEIPIQLWQGDIDQFVSARYSTEVVRANLPKKPEYNLVPNAGHFDFLPPCVSSSELCSSAADFDRKAFHDYRNESIATFFTTHLKKKESLINEGADRR
jgi:predicted dienelactone hydrolase